MTCPFPHAPANCVPSEVQAILKMLPVVGLSRLQDQPFLSQSLRVLKAPTAKSSPSGAQDTAVMGESWRYELYKLRP